MNENKPDRRVIKTRQNLFDALSSLMNEKRYSKITIQDIIDRANVGRSTFYAHFETKDDLLFARTEEYLYLLNNYVIGLFEQSGKEGQSISMEELFKHIQENKKVISSLFNSESVDMFFNQVQNYWNKSIISYLEKQKKKEIPGGVPIEILANHITNTLIGLLKWWILSKMTYTAKEMDSYFLQLITPCLDDYL